MMNEISKWIINWFVTEGEIEEQDIISNLDTNYFSAGFIDSFKFINMISDAEEKFEIEFDNEQFEDRSFSTINGLAKVIEKLIKNGKN